MTILICCLFIFFISPAQNEITVIFSGQQSKLVKFELQLIRELLGSYRDENNKRVRIKYKGVKDNNSIYNLLDQGDPDLTLVINKLVISKQKMVSYDFSEPYFHNFYLLGSRKDFIFNPNAKKVKVGHFRSRHYKQIVKSIDKSFIKETVEYAKSDRAYDDLKLRRIDLLLTDYIGLLDHNLKIATEVNSRFQKLAIMFKKGSKLKHMINKALANFKKTSKYAKLVKKYFGNQAETYIINRASPR